MATLKGGEEFCRRLDEISEGLTKGGKLKVGWPQGTTYPDSGIEVGLVAAFNEFGVPSHNQPPRPFMRLAIQENSPYWAPQIANLLQANDYDTVKVLNLMGIEIVGQVQDSIDKLLEPPLAPSTIARKGFDKPLIETNLMRSTVSFEVEEGKARAPQGIFSRMLRSLKSLFSG